MDVIHSLCLCNGIRTSDTIFSNTGNRTLIMRIHHSIQRSIFNHQPAVPCRAVPCRALNQACLSFNLISNVVLFRYDREITGVLLHDQFIGGPTLRHDISQREGYSFFEQTSSQLSDLSIKFLSLTKDFSL